MCSKPARQHALSMSVLIRMKRVTLPWMICNRCSQPGRLRHRGFECPGAALARHPALWDPHRADLLWPVAGAAGVSRLQINRVVSQVVGRPARRGGRLLPRGPARAVPGPRLRPNYPWLRRHPASNRGDLDGPLPARDRCEDCQARRAHPHRGVNATAHRRRPLSRPPPGAECRPGLPAWLSLDEGENDLTRFLTYLVAAL